MSTILSFPTAVHRQCADAIVDFFRARAATRAVLVVNSCARGTALPESDLDVAILIDPALGDSGRQLLEREWQEWYATRPVFRELAPLSRFACVHLDLFDGCWTAQVWDDGGGPDCFEIEIGNRVAHAVPLWDRGGAFADLCARWLPYYDEPLRRERLQMVTQSCRVNIARMQYAVGRRQYFQALDRLGHAFQEFLQAVFIARRVYPIAYNKWIREQVESWLGLPELYAELPSLFEVRQLESDELSRKSERLARLVETWTSPVSP